MKKFLNLPDRMDKPRTKGLTNLIDNGYNFNFFSSVIEDYHELIDGVKLGWGTSVVSPNLKKKIDLLNKHNIEYCFGGSFFEKSFIQNKVEDFRAVCLEYGCKIVEVSDGTIDLSREDKIKNIELFAKDFKVYSEVGYKDTGKSEELSPKNWIEMISGDLKAGATKVITESRESGTSGICRADGKVRLGLIEDIINCSEYDVNDLIFEAPNKQTQVYFIKKVNHNVNLANISFHDAIALETLRLGLRSDTLTDFEPDA